MLNRTGYSTSIMEQFVALSNIVGNSLKYTRRGTISISLSQEIASIRRHRPEQAIRFKVEDTGISPHNDHPRSMTPPSKSYSQLLSYQYSRSPHNCSSSQLCTISATRLQHSVTPWLSEYKRRSDSGCREDVWFAQSIG
jgi:hypothetical protein